MAHPVSKAFESYRQSGGVGQSGGAEAYINANLSVRDIEKNKYGEVFTPYSYICDLLDQLPARVWRDPGLRWLEPASGIGNFCLVIYMRLMDGLAGADAFPDPVVRHEHILRNMLFMVELNEENVARTRDLFGPLVNIQCADFLAGDECGASVSADIVIGNPPFQSPRDTARTSSKGGQTLWDKFIVKSLGILRQNPPQPSAGTDAERFLCFITPPAWRKPNSPHGLWSMMTTEPCSLQYLHMIDKKTAIRDLCVQQRMDLFIVRVGISGGGDDSDGAPCRVITSASDGNTLNIISPRDWPFLPNAEFESIQGILDPKGPNPHRVLYDRSAYGSDLPHMSPEYRAGEFIYPVVHTMTRRGLGLWYSNTKTRGTGHFGKAKVILNFNEKLYPYLDYSGEYGMGQFSFGLPVGGSVAAEGEAIVRVLNSPRFTAIVRATKWGAYQTDRRMFEYFREGWWRSPLFTTTTTTTTTTS